ncbi:MAG TPA: hypothetical protein VGW38_15350, partial [Chloroflexota bacterium]|nr:hypothetical protein [Chloroflexota bacterium]
MPQTVTYITLVGTPPAGHGRQKEKEMTYRDPDIPVTRQAVDSGWAIRHGVVGGLIAGVIFAMTEMIYAWITAGNFWGPMKMIAGIPLQTPPPQIDLVMGIIVGMMTHMVMSVMFGVIAAYIVAAMPSLRHSAMATVIFTSLFGLTLWLMNFYVIAPMLNAPWFASQANPLWQGFIAHTFFYGTV